MHLGGTIIWRFSIKVDFLNLESTFFSSELFRKQRWVRGLGVLAMVVAVVTKCPCVSVCGAER